MTTCYGNQLEIKLKKMAFKILRFHAKSYYRCTFLVNGKKYS